jgi:adenosine/AMP kinase
MEPNTTLYWNKVLKLHRAGYPIATIQNILKKEGLDEVLLTESLCKLKLIIHKKRKGRAVIIMVSGAFIMLFGFIITLVFLQLVQ